MFFQSYVQRQLAPLAPPDACSESTVVRFNITLAVKDGRVALDFDQVGCPGQSFIAIEEDCFVEITLHGDQLYFSKDLDGITTKEELASFYGGLTYSDYDKKLDRYRVVRFYARFNRGGKYGTNHGFNVNVDFLQGMDSKGPKWVALTIDPDIKNPPPIPG